MARKRLRKKRPGFDNRKIKVRAPQAREAFEERKGGAHRDKKRYSRKEKHSDGE